MIFHSTDLEGVVLIAPEKRGDERGIFARMFCADEFAAQGLETRFVQQNMSRSTYRGTLRGMHFQRAPYAEVKLIRCVAGAVYDVLVDLRPDSPTFKKWQGFELTDANNHTLYAPKGVAHGFMTLADDVEMTYLHSTPYTPAAEGGVRWDDPSFAITWPMAPTVMADKDKAWPDFGM
jgi:dTDP-4-dehydrorhamnose 3,5-epimerase